MKVALVHDYLKEYGGAERVLEALHEIWPKAPIFTAIYSPNFLGPHRERIKKWDIRPSFLQRFPFKEKLLSPSRFIAPWIFKSIDLSKYDLVVVSEAGTYVSPNFVKTGRKTKHLCYYHAPPRFLYGYPTAAPWRSIWWRRILFFFGQIPIHFLRLLDFEASQRPQIAVANSYETKARIEKFYRRKAKVIYPPVDIPERFHETKKENFYLAGGRLARPKRVDLAIKAANKLKISLKIFGRDFQNYASELKKMSGKTIEFLGEITDEEKFKLMAKAKAYIFPAESEEFGITPVEAMAVGTPVIALRSGGVVESVIEGKTGVFFKEATVGSLVEAIKKFEKMEIKSVVCVSHARRFSKERFVSEIKDLVNLMFKNKNIRR